MTQSILKPDRRKIVYRRNLKSHRFLPDNTINLYAEGYQRAFQWVSGQSGRKSYMYPRFPSPSFLDRLEKDFQDRVHVVMKGGYMQLSFDDDTDYVMFGLTYLNR